MKNIFFTVAATFLFTAVFAQQTTDPGTVRKPANKGKDNATNIQPTKANNKGTGTVLKNGTTTLQLAGSQSNEDVKALSPEKMNAAKTEKETGNPK